MKSHQLLQKFGAKIADMTASEWDEVTRKVDEQEARARRGRKLATVYYIWARDTEFMKIGRTSGHPAKRKAELQVGCPHELVLLASRRAYEEEIHEELKKSRVRGEWFRISEEMLRYLEHTGHPAAFAQVRRALDMPRNSE